MKKATALEVLDLNTLEAVTGGNIHKPYMNGKKFYYDCKPAPKGPRRPKNNVPHSN